MLTIKDYKLGNTIVAISTFPSKSALGLIKISGSKSLSIISKIFRPARKKDIKKVRTYTLHYGWIKDKPKSGKNKKESFIDEVLVSIMRKPHSYTKEDVVEVSSHGGVLVINKILDIILSEGARLALPGEFTYRALVNGRIDLLQAESILGVVEAKTDQSLALATSQLRGEASKKIEELKEEVKEVFIHTEGLINFPEDDLSISLSSLKAKIGNIEKRANSLAEGADEAKIIQEGVKCVICGKANVGKSTLFNRLLKEERVIVSRFSGTTRDVIEETINIRGVPLRIYDTAGILEPKDVITKKAVAKTSRVFDQADLVILLLDGSKPLAKDDFFLLDKAKTKNTILVINKSDLPQRLNFKEIPRMKSHLVKMSALEGKGLKRFEEAVYKYVYKGALDRENVIFLSHYQRQALRKVNESLKEIKSFLEQGHTIDFINLSLKDCLDNLGKVSGEVLSREVLEGIFSNFCIGK